MPLPKPPASRATILPNTAYESQAAPRSPRSSPKHSGTEQAERAPALELRNDAAPSAAPPLSDKGLPTKAPSKADNKIAPKTEPAPKARKPKRSGPAKLFVLDTNVLMHDPMSLFRFDEHDIYLPMITLEELDGHKKGMSEVSRNVRQEIGRAHV
jgi:PhoH-like ATPase